MISGNKSVGVIEPTKVGETRVKIKDAKGCLILMIRGSNSIQEIKVLIKNYDQTKLTIARILRNNRIAICFK